MHNLRSQDVREQFKEKEMSRFSSLKKTKTKPSKTSAYTKAAFSLPLSFLGQEFSW